MLAQATYIWIDGTQPTQTLRCKTKIIPHDHQRTMTPADFPEWGFDGSSTYQAPGSDSDLILKPVCVVNDPLLGHGNFLVLCEVLNPDGTPHPTNKRAYLREVLEKGVMNMNRGLVLNKNTRYFVAKCLMVGQIAVIQRRKALFTAGWVLMRFLVEN